MKKCDHNWKDVYYGIECTECGLFYPSGCESWLPMDDAYFEDDDYFYNISLEEDTNDDDPKSHSLECTCEHCIQNHPERECLYIPLEEEEQ